MRTKKAFFYTVILFFSVAVNAQQMDLPKKFLGFGWLVAFPYDIAFIPSDNLNQAPTVRDFFKQKRKYGLRLNDEDSVIAALRPGKHLPIKWHTGDTDYIQVIPVLAYYKLDYVFSKSRTDMSPGVDYSEMLQVYYYRNKVDSVFYRFGMEYDFDFHIIR
jgi:hypothetical protein